MVAPFQRSYLLAIDGSEHAQAAVRLLHDLLLRQQAGAARITVLTVFTPRQIGDLSPLREALEQTQAFFQERGYMVNSEFVLGYPAEKIMEYAERLQPQLIILGAKGLRGTLGILLGGVASHVVEYACCPVLIVRAPYRGINRILLTIDASIYSQKALEYTTRLHLPASADLRVIHVLPPTPIKPPPDFLTHTWPVGPEVLPPPVIEPTQEELTLQKKEEEEGQTLLQNAIQALSTSGLQARSVLLRGDAATEILEYSRYHEIDLIICGSRGLSPMRGWLLGSVSRKLVHYANCSVLVVKEASPLR